MIKNIFLLMLFSTTVIWANTTADSAYVFFDFARISAPIHGNEHLNGWVVTGMGMFIAFSCLLLIMFVVKYLPYALKLLDYIVPEKIVEEARKIQSINTETNEAIAAAVAVAYHNHNNDGR